MIDLSQFKKCPKCGESNVDTATRCSICGAEMNAAGPGFEREDALTAANAMQQPWQAGNQAAPPPPAPPPPPPPAGGISKPPTDGAALAKDEAEIAAARAKAAAHNPLNVLKRNLLAPALAATVIAVLITVGKEHKADAPAAAAVQTDPAADATGMFLDYTLQTGRDKGKTMRRFWAEYPLTFAAAARGRKVEDIGVSYVAQQSPLGGLIFDIFVVVRAEGERGILHPFRVDLETGEVSGATGCVFSPQNERTFAAEKCLPSTDVFPGGI